MSKQFFYAYLVLPSLLAEERAKVYSSVNRYWKVLLICFTRNVMLFSSFVNFMAQPMILSTLVWLFDRNAYDLCDCVLKLKMLTKYLLCLFCVNVFQALFPDNIYGVDSGGDPKEIPKLTFEEFKVFYLYISCNDCSSFILFSVGYLLVQFLSSIGYSARK